MQHDAKYLAKTINNSSQLAKHVELVVKIQITG